MHKYFPFIVFIFLLPGCWSEEYFEGEIKNAFPVHYYQKGDTLALSLQIEGEITDTLFLIVEKNQFELAHANSGVIIRSEHYEEQYNLEAGSDDGTKKFHLNAGTYYNDTAYISYHLSNSGLGKLLLFNKKLDTITIAERFYENVYLFGSDAAGSNYIYISRQDGIIEIAADSIVLAPVFP